MPSVNAPETTASNGWWLTLPTPQNDDAKNQPQLIMNLEEDLNLNFSQKYIFFCVKVIGNMF